MADELAERASRRPWRTAAEALLWVAVIGCPLARGGVDPPVFFALALVAALALALVAFARRREGMPFPPAALALCGGALVALLSALPLPAFLVGLVSPRARALATLPPEPAHAFLAWSLDPPASLVDAVRLAALAAVLLTAAALARREAAARRLSASVAVAGLTVGVVSVAHALAHTTLFFGLFQVHEEPLLATTFVNPNHGASLFVLATAASIGLFRSMRTNLARFGWGAAATANGLFAMAMLSNGGIAALGVVGLLVVVLAATRARRSHGERSLFGPIVIVAVVLSAALLVGAENLVDQLREVPLAAQGKSWPWLATLRLIRDHFLTGVGRGAYAAAFSAYVPARTLATITHPENVVLQWMAEWGVPVSLAGFALLGMTLVRAWQRPGSEDDPLLPVHDALLAGLVAVLLHDLVDFGLEYAGVGVAFCIALGVVAGRSAGRTRLDAKAALALAGALAFFVLPLGIVASHRLVDVQLAKVARKTRGAGPKQIDAAYRGVRAAHPADPFVDVSAADRLLDLALDRTRPLGERSDAVRRALPFLARSQELWANDEPHLLTARALALIGHRGQALTELRLAFAIGGNTGAVVDEALRMGATPEELATLPVALAHAVAGTAEVRAQFSPGRQATVVVGYLRNERRLAQLSRRTAGALLADPKAPWADDQGFLDEACQATVDDAEGAQLGRPGMSSKDELPELSRALATIARRLQAAHPDDGKGYWCRFQSLLFAGHPKRADEVLAAGVKALPRDVPLHVSWARRLFVQHEVAQAVGALSGITDAMAGPYRREVRERRVAALRAAGRMGRAQEEAEDAVEANGNQSWAHRLLAGTLAAAGLDVRAAREAGVAARLTSGPERAALEKWKASLLTQARRELPPPAGEPALAP